MEKSSEAPIIYRFSPIRFIVMASPILILFIISLALNWAQWTQSLGFEQWIMGGFFLLFLLALIFMPGLYYLILEKEGFTIHYLGGKRFYNWNEVGNFRVVQTRLNFIPIGNKIVFDLRQDSIHKTELIRASRAVRNFIPNKAQAYDNSFISIFKPNSNTLVKILNTYVGDSI